ncbi:MAG: MATE family efflux transporter [Coriobacteriales bacterium]|jgi:putative MATE family efflux protein|nr:MATE family efflux transporter [Coriobacteriales bacterium]
MQDSKSDELLPQNAHAAQERPTRAEPVLAQAEAALELDPTLELDARQDEDYTPDEPVSRSGMQYTEPVVKPGSKTVRTDDKVNRMGTASLGKLIVEFAVPSIISMVVNGSYNVLASIFLGLKLGEMGLATVTVATPLMTLALAISVLVGAGGNALAAIKLGEGKRETAERVIANTFILSVVLAVICTILVFLFMDPLLRLSGSTEELLDPSRVFVGITAAGFIFQFLGMGFNNFMRTAGNPNGALYTILAGILTSIVLSYLFVMVFDWGIAGSAWATIIGMFVLAVLVLHYFTRSKKAPFKLRFSLMKPNPRLMANICVLGSAGFFLQAAAVVINLLLNHQLVYYGALDPIGAEGALAAVGVMMRIAFFAFFPLLGISVAIQPLLGYNYGARFYPRVKKTFWISLIWVAAFGVFFWLLVHLFPSPLVMIFGIKSELQGFTIKAIQVMMFLMPFIGLQILGAGYFQATGQPIKSMFLSLTRQLLYLIPLLYFLPLAIQFFVANVTPLQSLYYAYPIADVLSVLTAGTMMFFEWKRLTRLQEAGK